MEFYCVNHKSRLHLLHKCPLWQRVVPRLGKGKVDLHVIFLSSTYFSCLDCPA